MIRQANSRRHEEGQIEEASRREAGERLAEAISLKSFELESGNRENEFC